VVLLLNTFPFFVPIIAFLTLGTLSTRHLFLGIFIGFIGIMLILKPGVGMFHMSSFLPLISAVGTAISIFSMRLLSKTESNLSIVLSYFIIASLLSAFFSFPYWQHLSLYDWGLLITVGLVASFYQICLTQALRDAQARLVSSLYYTTIPFSVLIEWFYWGHWPSLLTGLGIIIVCLSAIYVVYLGTPIPTSASGRPTSD
jgi:drug/metabolite transporter (DMT)-like permease